MDLFTKIIKVYADLSIKDFYYRDGLIQLNDDGDGKQYIARWDYEQPIPEGLKLGK